MVLMASGSVPESAIYGTATALPFVEVAVFPSSLRIPVGNTNPTRARLTFAKTTGIFHGSFIIPFSTAQGQTKTVSANYAGVLLPGWTGDCGCGVDEVVLPEKPFGMGSYWFRDWVPVGVGGRSQMVPAAQGYPIIMKKVAE